MKKLKLFLNVLFSLSAVVCLIVAVSDRLNLNTSIVTNNAFQSALLLIIIGFLSDKHLVNKLKENR
ncbi:MAG: hypothetical protein ACPG52_07780 [Cognaticolwellia sp.]